MFSSGRPVFTILFLFSVAVGQAIEFVQYVLFAAVVK